MGFTKDGLARAWSSDSSVVYQLKSSSGEVLKTYKVCPGEEAKFEELASAERAELERVHGSVQLVKLQKLF